MATKDDSDVRLSDALSEGEEKGTRERREKVFTCLQSLEIHCPQDNVPKIAVLGSGGGLRAMIAMLGTLVELKKQNLLDAVMYLGGVSGSTWCMSLLYEDRNWSEKLVSLEKELVETLSRSSWDSGRAAEYAEEASQDDLYSLTDFWAAFLVYRVLKQISEKELPDHREASETGINPYPIYAAVDKKKLGEDEGNFPGTWFEFTPHESGYTALGAFVSTKYLESEFEFGKLKKRGKNKSICYMQALWGSALASMTENIQFIKESLQNILPFWGNTSLSATESDPEASKASEAILLVLDLEMCAVSGSDPKEVFDKMLALLSEHKGKSASYQLCIEMRNTWATKTKEERLESCAELCNELAKEFGVDLGEGGTQEGELHSSHEIQESDPEASKASEAILLVLDLEMCAVSGSDPKEVFDKMLALLSEHKGKSASYQLCIKMRNTWATKTKEERLESCAELCNELAKEFGVDLGEGGTQEGELHSSHEIQGSVRGLLRMTFKTVRCVATWKWGTMNNFLYNCPDIQPAYLGKNKIMSLIDAGLAIHSAYPLVLRAERRADLIMSFDFSTGDPFELMTLIQDNLILVNRMKRHGVDIEFLPVVEEIRWNCAETIKKAAAYCQKNGIPFPKIDDQELDEKNPSDCYVFRGNKSCPTVMHFPLFNRVNCPGEIEEYRKKFTAFTTSYPEEDIKDLLMKAGLNVSNNKIKILNEINQHLLSSPTK